MSRYTVCILALVAVTSVLSNNLPGLNKSPGEQCRARGYSGVCRTPNPAERCTNLQCAETERGDIPMPNEVGPALEGTACGDNKICIGGKCIVNGNYIAEKVVEFEYGCWEF